MSEAKNICPIMTTEDFYQKCIKDKCMFYVTTQYECCLKVLAVKSFSVFEVKDPMRVSSIGY